MGMPELDVPARRSEGKLIALVVVTLGTKARAECFNVLGRTNRQAKLNVVRDVVHGRVTQRLSGANAQPLKVAGDIAGFFS